MIFSNGLDDKVRDGTKTQTRRLLKESVYAGFMINHKIIGVYDQYNRPKWVVDNTYAIQSGRGKKGNGRFRITKIRKERVKDINCKDCIAEGLTTKEKGHDAGVHLRKQFIALWNSLHPKGKRWEDNPEVWVLEIEHVASG